MHIHFFQKQSAIIIDLNYVSQIDINSECRGFLVAFKVKSIKIFAIFLCGARLFRRIINACAEDKIISLQCAAGILYTMPCPEGTSFNPDIGVCDHSYNVPGCGDITGKQITAISCFAVWFVHRLLLLTLA